MLVTDRHRAGSALLPIIDVAVDAGVDVVQIREKDLRRNELLGIARDIASTVRGRAHVVVNSDIDVAGQLGIGLHLPESAAPLRRDCALELGPNVLLGRSVHSARVSVEERVDYLLFGHVFSTGSKPGLRPRGLDALSEVVEIGTQPVWAIGGITADNAAEVISRGAQGIAVIGAIFDAPDPSGAARALRSEIDRAFAAHSAKRSFQGHSHD